MTPTPIASLDLTPGTQYTSMRHNHQNRCEVICEATAIHSLQEMIVYHVLEGRDAGRCFVCSLLDFALRFERAPEPVSAEPALVADMSEKGAGF